MRLTISDAVVSILKRDTPIFMIDTCAFLDLIRAPIRDMNNRIVRGGYLLAELCERDAVTIVITDQNEQEFQVNKPKVLDELRKFISTTKNHVKQIKDAIAIFRAPPEPTAEIFSQLTLDHDLEALADKLVASSIMLTQEDSLIPKAYVRVTGAIPPSHTGKNEMKDCVIIEHFLALLKSLSEANFQRESLFVTSNSRDFGQAPKASGQLAQEFADFGVKYCDHIQWALSEARLLKG